ncbi:NAD(P)-dependent oxidoreductase [Nesterenkonia cremea]|uniref:NAD-dependent epimerase n=1 Tax=Nesterenkonia cremea TaxID=1882340 RepID=A0A917AQV8_9MICC|nr:NAD(P)H-binding protein [Nesterenkonia cremea]GGE67564.1 NAD-dependent epimerase [Nesterenkonia cremea]
MARITVLGGTGYAGSHIAKEAAARGHDVLAVSRRAPEDPVEGVRYVIGDVLDEGFLKDLAAKSDLLMLALSPRGDMQGRVIEAARKLIPVAAEAGVRVGVIGGAGALRVSEGGPRLIDTEDFPEEIKPESFEMLDVLEALQTSEDSLDWFYIHPAAGFGSFHPGERRGAYRVGGEVLLSDREGKSEISGADFALAILDEIEKPVHRRRRFSAAY